MSTLVKKGSVKLLVVACVLACLIGIIMPLTASAAGGVLDLLFPGLIVDPLGAEDITEFEAWAAHNHYLTQNDIWYEVGDFDDYTTEVDDVYKCVIIYDPNGDVYDVVYKDESGNYRSYTLGYSITFPVDSMGNIVTTVSVGVKGVFDMAAEAFLFLTSNDMCMFMIAVTFGGIAIAFVGRSFKTARK